MSLDCTSDHIVLCIEAASEMAHKKVIERKMYDALGKFLMQTVCLLNELLQEQ